MDMSTPEMKAVLDAIAILHVDRERGRVRLLQLWEELAPEGNPLQRCALAHFLADTETDAAHELEWDLRALEAATGSREAGESSAGRVVPESYLPSLYLSVADGYRRLGDLARARGHAHVASQHISALGDDGYGNMVRDGLRRLQATLATPAESPTTRPKSDVY